MNSDPAYYDVAIVGGGLAGLATAIQFGREGFRVILFEKETYPFHKVCGEYISLESLGFLQSLGFAPGQLGLPQMDTLLLSSSGGNALQQRLPLGGFGISRYRLDQALAQLAKEQGVEICDGVKVQDVQWNGRLFKVATDHVAVTARVCCGAFGKRSNLDVKWQRAFTKKRPHALNNFIGVKYHATLDHPRNMIALHNFPGGYCGIAPIEDNKVNICYLTTAQNLRDHGNNLQAMEEQVLFKNPLLKKAFADAEFLYGRPLTISQISFDKKEQVASHILLLGDAAGMITPLCGNGMSMALLSSGIAAPYIRRFLHNDIDRATMEASYMKHWKKAFSARLGAGRIIQEIFARQWLTDGIIRVLRPLPFITRSIIRRTHG